MAPATDRLIVITGGGSGIGVPNRLLGFARHAKNEKRCAQLFFRSPSRNEDGGNRRGAPGSQQRTPDFL
ncbi:MAG: hypothetical protein QOH35_5755 [Acidobacteriaceae bacterium]|nr:hypothetical protein [Acidobacteriaceae bacterium]MEA2544389.1 hypothetical protein [Acidobacteriaceae bacterium]